MSDAPPEPEDSATALRRAALLRESGDAAGAAEIYRRLAARHPAEAKIWALLGDALGEAGETAAALAALEKASVLAPENDDIAVEFALALQHSNRPEEAIAALSNRGTRLDGTERAQALLGDAHRAAGRPGDAIAPYRRVLALAPDNNNARISLAVCLQEAGDIDAAIETYEQALEQNPNAVDALTNLGLAQSAKGRHDEALASLERAIVLDPKDPAARCNLGVVLQKLMRTAEAAACFEEAIARAPDYADAWSNLGNARQDQLRLADARAAHDRAVDLAPDNADTHWNRAMTLLLSGDYAAGFAEYEWRDRTADHAPPSHDSPRWDGKIAAGARLLLLAEQGFGDAIQFIRYAPLLARKGAAIVIQCHPKLAALFETLDGAPTVVAAGSPLPPVDAHAPLMSLPHLLATTPDSAPAEIPYLRAPADARTPPSGDGRRRVGLCWSGNPKHPDNPQRSCPFAALGPLLAHDDIDWISLQFGPAAAEGEARLGTDWSGQLDGYANTAAAVEALDLVIAVDTATAHLAGALGRPVWLMLKYAPDWRWMTGRDDSPWYPTMRLFRQETPGDWAGVAARLDAALDT